MRFDSQAESNWCMFKHVQDLKNLAFDSVGKKKALKLAGMREAVCIS